MRAFAALLVSFLFAGVAVAQQPAYEFTLPIEPPYHRVRYEASDRPGELARLFADVGEAGVNIEDVRIDHSPGTPAGLVELAIRADAEDGLLRALAARGWVVHG